MVYFVKYLTIAHKLTVSPALVKRSPTLRTVYRKKEEERKKETLFAK